MKTNLKLKQIRNLTVALFIIFSLESAICQQSSSFLTNMSAFCGRSYAGEVIFPEGDKNPFLGQTLMVIFKSCSDSILIMPFHVGEDQSRTWILKFDNGQLLFKHDHRHSDGTPDSISNYGGYALGIGDQFNQIFPADTFTADLLPAAATNEWAFRLNQEVKTLNYELKRNDQLRFKAVFDLNKPI